MCRQLNFKPQPGQMFRAYEIIGAGKHYHCLCPFLCTQAGRDFVESDEWKFCTWVWRFEANGAEKKPAEAGSG